MREYSKRQLNEEKKNESNKMSIAYSKTVKCALYEIKGKKWW